MYTLVLDSRAQSDLRRLPPTIVRGIRSKVNWLCENCDAHRHKALKGKHKGKFTLKMNDYRVLYSFDKRVREITVHQVGHRSRVY